jgi:hypothetical protein
VFDRMAGTQVVPANNDIDAAPLTRRER